MVRVTNVKRPSLFKDKQTTRERLQKIGDALVEGTLDAGLEAARKHKPNATVKRMPKYLQVTEKRLHEKLGVIDLKPYFARSKYAKPRKFGGGWYLRVPIRRKARSMSRRMYEELRAVQVPPGVQKVTVVSNYLYDRRRDSEAKMLNYTPRSHLIEKRRIGTAGNRHVYTAFRTVSDKSPANSWIVNRHKVNVQDTSKTFVRNVDRLIKWKMRNGWG